MGSYDGRVAVVTGGGRGLGRAIALELAGRGAKVVVNDFFEDAASEVTQEITDAGGTAQASAATVASFASARDLVGQAVAAWGRLDYLVTCAGTFARSPILDVEEDEWDAITGVHLTGHVACVRAASAQMVAQGEGGRIVTVSSRGGLFGREVAYAGAKSAILGLTAAASRELAPYGITVNCLLPSAQTQLFTSGPATRRFGGMPESLHMEPEYIAPLAAWLCLPEAAGVTGRFLYASGGDVCVYAPPLQVEQTTTFVRNTGSWTVEGLSDYLPELLGQPATTGARA